MNFHRYIRVILCNITPGMFMKRITRLLSLMLIALAFGCGKAQIASPVPYVTVNYTLNMNDPLYINLNNQGGFVYLDNVGYKGIIVVHDFADNFWALDRTCPYHVDATCAKVVVSSSGLNILCGSYKGSTFTSCCGSKYALDGSVMNGPATIPLKRYNCAVSSSVVTITN
jgi:Rieske Fe-S protein